MVATDGVMAVAVMVAAVMAVAAMATEAVVVAVADDDWSRNCKYGTALR